MYSETKFIGELEMNKIIAFIGSARKEGFCTKTVDAIKKGAESEGAEVVVYNLSDLNMKSCVGCMYCRQGNGCSIKDDDMSKIYSDFEEATAVVFAMPIYFGQASGQSLTLINRFYPLVPPKTTKKAITIYAHGAPGKEAYKNYIDMTDPIFKSFGLDIQKTIVCAGTSSMSEEDKEALWSEAFEAGKALCNK